MIKYIVFILLFLIIPANYCYATRGDTYLIFVPLVTYLPAVLLTLLCSIFSFIKLSFSKALARFFLAMALQIVSPILYFLFMHTSFANDQSDLFYWGITLVAGLLGFLSIWILLKPALAEKTKENTKRGPI